MNHTMYQVLQAKCQFLGMKSILDDEHVKYGRDFPSLTLNIGMDPARAEGVLDSWLNDKKE